MNFAVSSHSRQLRNNTTVIYNGEIAIIKGNSSTDNAFIKLLSNPDSLHPVKKSQLKSIPHDTGDLIKYKKIYYLILNITLDSRKIPIYEIGFVNSKKDKKEEPKCILSNDEEIKTIPKEKHELTISYLKYIDRYNSAVSFLNERIKTDEPRFSSLSYKDVDTDMHNFFQRCHLTITQLNNVMYAMKKSQNPKFNIKNIYKNPFDFISQEIQLITYDKAEKIEEEYSLNISFKIKIEKWSYYLFLKEKRAFYIPEWMYKNELKQFCEKRQQNFQIYVKYIDKIILDITIEGEKYKTTEYLFNIEKSQTNMTIELFYDEIYDIPTETIEEIINKYEEKQSRLHRKQFLLEKEQRTSVIATIQNKLSIIVGPPGTGKTEIVKCINYVFHELKKQYDNDDSSSISTNDSEDNTTNESFDEKESDYTYINSNAIALMAPTGLAFVNMTRSQLEKYYSKGLSGTCHKAIYHNIPEIKNSNRENNKSINNNIQCFEIDETSMIDSFMFYEILKTCKYFNSRLILIGDTNQLPSVDPGQVLNNLVNSRLFKVTKLSKIKRQESGALVKNILKMTEGTVSIQDITDNTMSLLPLKTFITNDALELNKIKLFIEENNLTKHTTKFIAGYKVKKFTFNTVSLNKILQDIFNPITSECKDEIIHPHHYYENTIAFRVGDNIIRTENDNSKEPFRANGEIATILSFNGKKATVEYKSVTAQLSENIIEIGALELYENFALDYCTTVHKSQGSQYDNVVYMIDPTDNMTEKKNIYTAISRGREKCFIISNPDDFIRLQNNKKNDYLKKSLFMSDLFTDASEPE
jgi:ATP-dependent exoDNAse (exonuclease V) alpha subunit